MVKTSYLVYDSHVGTESVQYSSDWCFLEEYQRGIEDPGNGFLVQPSSGTSSSPLSSRVVNYREYDRADRESDVDDEVGFSLEEIK